jgi:hypothetical protein
VTRLDVIAQRFALREMFSTMATTMRIAMTEMTAAALMR